MAIHSSPVARYEHRSTACIFLRFRRDRGNFALARLAKRLARVVFPSSSGHCSSGWIPQQKAEARAIPNGAHNFASAISKSSKPAGGSGTIQETNLGAKRAAVSI
jgi:hypothetical protein